MNMKFPLRPCAVLFFFLIAGCGAETEPATPSGKIPETASEVAPPQVNAPEANPVAQLNSLAEEYWQYRLESEPYTSSRHGLALQRIPTGSLSM